MGDKRTFRLKISGGTFDFIVGPFFRMDFSDSLIGRYTGTAQYLSNKSVSIFATSCGSLISMSER